jgi:hypothetical protein
MLEKNGDDKLDRSCEKWKYFSTWTNEEGNILCKQTEVRLMNLSNLAYEFPSNTGY